MSVECFVTGGTGFIGQHLVAYLSAKGHTIRVLMRRPERLAALREQINNLGGCASRVFAVAGDLERDNLGLSLADREVLRHVGVVFHLGAHFAWGLSVEHSRAVNVEGAKRVALLAAEQKSRLVMLGGYMLKNQEHLQRIGIDPRCPELTNWLTVYQHVGAYEGSKLEAHFAVLELMSAKGGEMTIVHPATVCGHSRTGHILDGQPLVELIRNLVQGKLTAVPGTAEHWLPLVTVDHLVELVAACAFDPAMGRQELLALDDQTPPPARTPGAGGAAFGLEGSQASHSAPTAEAVIKHSPLRGSLIQTQKHWTLSRLLVSTQRRPSNLPTGMA